MKEKENKKIIRLCGDVIFKSIFLKEKDILLKMIYDITNIKETSSYEEIIPGYELESYKIDGKINRCDLLVKIGNKYFINIELNYLHEKNVLYRNMIQLFRISIQITESGMTDKELSNKHIGQLNFNTFSNNNNKEILKGYYQDDEGNKLNDLLTFWNIDIVKCYKKVYNNIENVQKLPKEVRWGALLYTDIQDIEMINKIIGDDLLSMEERTKLIASITDIVDNTKILQKWMIEENDRLKQEGQMAYAKEEGIKQGLEQGLEQGLVQGIKQGSEEKNKEVIINMLKEKLNYDFISRVTGKSVEEIKKIETSM